jgi:Peptidase family M28/PDZ domain
MRFCAVELSNQTRRLVIRFIASREINIMWKRLLLFAVLAGSFLENLIPTVVAENLVRKNLLEALVLPELKIHIDRLADDTFEGREAGSRGGNASAGYIVNRLAKTPFQPAGENGTYFQSFGEGYRNILAYCEGSDPTLKQEVIVVGAHFDHVGYGTQRNSYGPWGYIHNGADDNASGTAALLELAACWKQLAVRPARSLLIAFWDAEEKGLLGSKHWCNHPTLEWTRLKCFVNIDMIGRLTHDRVEVYGVRTAPGFRRLVSEANVTHPLRLDFDWTMKEDSDHFPFFQRELPVLMFHTGLHADYHRPSDDVERINVAGAERVTKLICSTVLQLTESPQVAAFRAISRRENETTRQMQEASAPQNSPRFGATWKEHAATEGVHLHVTQVVFASAAQRAGIETHDTITHLNGAAIPNEATFRRQMLQSQDSIQLRLERGGKSREVTVTLQGKPVRYGISWRPDAGEPGTVMITNVIYGSPAHEAKLKPQDRIYAVDGRPFATAEAFQTTLENSTETVILTCEREGRLFDATLQLLP